MTRAAVLGSPIAHSLSPVLHRAAYDALGLDWTYDAVECDEAALPATLDRLCRTHRGLSLTMPLKRAVVPLLDELDPLAAATGVVNTVVVERGRRVGHNTDVAGIAAVLRDVAVTVVRRAVVLGGGATATSAVAALARLGDRAPRVLARDRARAAPLLAAAARLGAAVEVLPWRGVPVDADVVVSTVPAGAADSLAAAPWPGAVLLDVVYAPWPTPLARAAAASGAAVAGGLEMLVAQAAEQVRLMTGRPAPSAAMRHAGAAALVARR